ncbi:hypothetical protein KDM41_05260, partial [bacterium]|nr:hypothetical protein [bacterium]
MAPPRVIPVPFATDTLDQLAADLSALPGAAGGDLAAALVLLPGSRACRDLGHLLLERAAGGVVLLPRIVTPTRWALEMATATGLDADRIPDDRLRPLVLAPRLARLPWLAERPESAPGLARELVAFFDEARLAERPELLDADGPDAASLPGVRPAEAPVVAQDLARVREAWRLYREVVPRDGVDRLVDLSRALRRQPPAPRQRPRMALAAGFGRIDVVRGRLLRAALDTGEDGRLYVPTAAAGLARAFVATWGREP